MATATKLTVALLVLGFFNASGSQITRMNARKIMNAKLDETTNATEMETGDSSISEHVNKDNLPIEKCMVEHKDIDRYHVYKAYDATKFMHGKVIDKMVGDPEVKVHDQLVQISNIENGSDGPIYVNTGLSECIFRLPGLKENNESFIFYLKPTDEKLVTGGKVETGKVWTWSAEPTPFSRKKWREIKKYYRSPDKVCDGKSCANKAPFVKSKNEFSEVEKKKLNERLQVECQMRGYPQPHMYWTFNGTPLNVSSFSFSDSPQIQIKTTWKKSVLEIPFVSGDHEGNYSCIGTNFKDTPAVNYFTLQLKDDHVTKCTDDYKGYCMNGGMCFHLVQEKTSACYCQPSYGGSRCQYYNPFWELIDPPETGGWGMVPLKDVLLLALIIFIVCGSLFASTCLYFSHRSKRYKKKMQKSLNQSFDYSNHLVLNNPSKKERTHYSIVATTSPKRWTSLTSSFNSGSKNKTHNDTNGNQSDASNANKKHQQTLLSKDQEEPRTTTGNKKKRCKSSGDTSSHGDNLTPTGVATVSSGPRVKKDLLTLPLNCPDEVVASQVKRNKVKRTGKSSLLVDFDEERSDKSDETDATSTKEHRQSKDSAGNCRQPQHKQRNNSLIKSPREVTETRSLQGQSPRVREAFEDPGQKKLQSTPNRGGDTAEMLSDDDSPSPMSSSELSLDKFLSA